MKNLAIYYGHNGTVALSDSGKIAVNLSEERLCRVKNATGLPKNALNYVCETYLDGDIRNADGVHIVDGTGSAASKLVRNLLPVEGVTTYYWKDKPSHIVRSRPRPFTAWHHFQKDVHRRFNKATGRRQRRLERAKAQVCELIGSDPQRTWFHDHHLCHAASAIYFDPVNGGDDWLLLTLDGQGDGLSSTVSLYRNGEIKRLASNPITVSLGAMFAEVTSYLGMKADAHEFKLMGLAPYADPDHVGRVLQSLRGMIWMTPEGQFQTIVPGDDMLPLLTEAFAFERFDVVAGAIQALTEELVVEWSEYWLKTTGLNKVAVSGGVFMNVKAAKRLSESPLVDQVFVVPSAGDESTPIGALWLAATASGQPIVPVEDLYLGRHFDSEHVAKMIVRDGLNERFEIEQLEDATTLARRVASLLASDEIVARCSGREEWGARALGNRSILSNPSNFGNIERLNSKIKARDFWMPFTPSILSERLGDYIENDNEIFAPYMAITFDTTPLAKNHFTAAIHPRDFTMRPQQVLKEWNPGYHAILSAFDEITGIGGVLNTSFNLHGEPNVGSPEDAIRTVENSGLDYVVIENYLFRKRMN
jgi:carbamoyltransferase